MSKYDPNARAESVQIHFGALPDVVVITWQDYAGGVVKEWRIPLKDPRFQVDYVGLCIMRCAEEQMRNYLDTHHQ